MWFQSTPCDIHRQDDLATGRFAAGAEIVLLPIVSWTNGIAAA